MLIICEQASENLNVNKSATDCMLLAVGIDQVTDALVLPRNNELSDGTVQSAEMLYPYYN